MPGAGERHSGVSRDLRWRCSPRSARRGRVGGVPAAARQRRGTACGSPGTRAADRRPLLVGRDGAVLVQALRRTRSTGTAMNGARLLLVNAHGADEFSGGAERYVAQLADGMGEDRKSTR